MNPNTNSLTEKVSVFREEDSPIKGEQKMKRKRRNHSSAFKVKAALAAPINIKRILESV